MHGSQRMLGKHVYTNTGILLNIHICQNAFTKYKSRESYLVVEKYRSNSLGGCLQEPKNNGKSSWVFQTVVISHLQEYGCIYGGFQIIRGYVTFQLRLTLVLVTLRDVFLCQSGGSERFQWMYFFLIPGQYLFFPFWINLEWNLDMEEKYENVLKCISLLSSKYFL